MRYSSGRTIRGPARSSEEARSGDTSCKVLRGISFGSAVEDQPHPAPGRWRISVNTLRSNKDRIYLVYLVDKDLGVFLGNVVDRPSLTTVQLDHPGQEGDAFEYPCRSEVVRYGAQARSRPIDSPFITFKYRFGRLTEMICVWILNRGCL